AFPDRFPTTYASCTAAGIDPARALIPIAPAAHYHMGGVSTDGHGRTSLDGLWAVGEVASTGVHGANRLASNSLLEAVVFSARAAQSTFLPSCREWRPRLSHYRRGFKPQRTRNSRRTKTNCAPSCRGMWA